MRALASVVSSALVALFAAAPGGDIVFADFLSGRLRRISYIGPPRARD